MQPLLTERLRLRPLVEGDLDALHASQSRADVTRFLPYGPRSREEVARHLEAWVQPDAEVLMLERRSDAIPLGQLYLFRRPHQGGELGWSLHPDHQGHGYATEAARAGLEFAFNELGLHRVYARVEPRNLASIAVCRRLGMRRESHRPAFCFLVGEWRGQQIFARLAREPEGLPDFPEGAHADAPAPNLRLPVEVPDLRTERLHLRPLTTQDLEDTHAYQSLPEVACYMSFEARTREQVAAFLSEAEGRRRLEGPGDWVQLSLDHQGQSVGNVYVKLLADANAELGWSLHPAHQGRGFATEALRSVVAWLFALGLHRVEAQVDPRNAASLALCARLGMRQEALYVDDVRLKGEWASTAVFALNDSQSGNH